VDLNEILQDDFADDKVTWSSTGDRGLLGAQVAQRDVL